MRYINREDLLEKTHTGMSTIELMRAIIDAPVADVRENVRGEWERVDGFTGVEAFGFKETTVEGWSCSICDFEIDVSEKSFNYCPNCGADMRGENDGNSI